MTNKLLSTILGVAVGDALGFPAQFYSRRVLHEYPLVEMAPSKHWPAGTYSDDTATTLCTLESLQRNNWQLDLQDIMNNFVRWLNDGYLTCDGVAMDIGRATRKAIQRYYNGAPLEQCGCTGYYECGNGSLMRITPAIFYLLHHPEADAYEAVKQLSALTHAHETCILACYIYVEVCLALYAAAQADKMQTVFAAVEKCKDDAETKFSADVMRLYWKVWDLPRLVEFEESMIESSCYVLDSLEASLWSFLTTDNYHDCILKAVALGGDTDSIAAIAGGMAGLYYGAENIPQEWVAALRNKDVIYKLCAEI